MKQTHVKKQCSLKIDTLKAHLAAYNLEGVNLVVRQGLNARQEIDFAQVKASILDEVFKNQDTTIVAVKPDLESLALPDISAELRALSPQVDAYTLQRVEIVRTDSLGLKSKALMCVANSKKLLRSSDRARIQHWLVARFPSDSVQVLVSRLE